MSRRASRGKRSAVAGLDMVAFCLKCDRAEGGTAMRVIWFDDWSYRVACECGAEVDITFRTSIRVPEPSEGDPGDPAGRRGASS